MDWERLFGLSSSGYAASFLAVVLASPGCSDGVKLGAMVLLTVLAVFVVADLKHVPSRTLLAEFRSEFIGMGIMVALTCSPGALGFESKAAEYLTHLCLMALADWSCGGPQVNPAVTMALKAAGMTPKKGILDLVVYWAAQLGGGIVGWVVLIVVLPCAGGPRPNADVPLPYLFASEAIGVFVLVGAVFAFATTIVGSVYPVKISFINAALRLVILAHGATGPAVNPALASAYALVAGPGVDARTHILVYWAGGLAGATAMGLVWRGIRAATQPPLGAQPHLFDHAAAVALGVYFAALVAFLWTTRLRGAAEVEVEARLTAAALAKRNIFQKVLRHKPKLAPVSI